jgi:LysR family transcriptional regulator, low CO2-responsive transcriptional regulator
MIMNLRHITLNQVRIFLSVARHLSFAKAAQALHLSPPAVSLQVKQLAETVGQALFEQIGKKIFLTQAGKVLVSACQDIENRLEALSQDLLAIHGVEQGQLRLAIITTVKYTVPVQLGAFCKAHRGIDVTLFVGNRETLLQRLHNNEDDLYIMGQPPEGTDAESQPFADNPLVVIAPPDHPLAGKKNIPPLKMAQETFIQRETGSGTRLTTESFFVQHGVKLRTKMEISSHEAIKQTVASGLGLAVVSASTVKSELALGQLVTLDIKGFPLIRRWYVVHRRGKKLSPAALMFRDRLLQE